MDAHAHLLALGWAGPGHALDSRPYKQKGHRGLAYDPNATTNKSENNGNGLVKPLLISQRKTRFGIGKKAHEPSSGNEWWLKGFQTALQNIGKSESERSSGTTTPINGNSKHAGLYGYFIKGQMMQGTIGQDDTTAQRGKKRKSDVLDQDEHVGIPADALAITCVSKQKTSKDFEDAVTFLTERDKERKRKAKTETVTDVDQFTQIGQFFGAASIEAAKSKKKGHERQNAEQSSGGASTPQSLEETKEERRERRRRKKEQNGNLSLAQMVEEELAKLNSQGSDDNDEDDSAVRAARKAERKRRKAEKSSREVSIKA